MSFCYRARPFGRTPHAPLGIAILTLPATITRTAVAARHGFGRLIRFNVCKSAREVGPQVHRRPAWLQKHNAKVL